MASPLRRKRTPLDVSQILAQQAGDPQFADVGLPVKAPDWMTGWLPGGGGGEPQGAEFGPGVQTNVPNTGKASDYGPPAPAGPAVGAGGQALEQTTRTPTPAAAPVDPLRTTGFGSLPSSTPNSSTSRPSGQYTTVGDIFAEPEPQTTDPTAWYAFHQDRFRKVANHYGLDPREVAEQEATVAAQIAAQNAARSKAGEPTLTGPEVANIWKAYQQNLVATRDFNPEQSMQPTQPAQDTMLTGTDGGNPLARYGVYSPEQVAGIQAAIGQYVTGVGEKSQAQTGFKTDPQTAQAYMMQAQALPAINALEGQQRLAQQVYDLEDQVRYYQALQQTGQLGAQQQQAAPAQDDMSASIAAIMEQLG